MFFLFLIMTERILFPELGSLFSNREAALNWYRELTPNQRVQLKDCSVLIGGISWEQLTQLDFSFDDKIVLLYNKLKSEGFDV